MRVLVLWMLEPSMVRVWTHGLLWCCWPNSLIRATPESACRPAVCTARFCEGLPNDVLGGIVVVFSIQLVEQEFDVLVGRVLRAQLRSDVVRVGRSGIVL